MSNNKMSNEDFVKKFRDFIAEVSPAPNLNPTNNPVIGALLNVIEMVKAQDQPNGRFHNLEAPACETPATQTATPKPTASTIAIIEPGAEPSNTVTATPATSTPAETGERKPKNVTIDGKAPAVPKSFFHTKKFLAIGAATAVIIGVLGYLIYSGRL